MSPADSLRYDAWDPLGTAEREARFAARAIERFREQARTIAPYGAYARHLGIDPAAVRDWRDIPPVPASAFKSHDLSSSEPGMENVLFETSGTTISRPGCVRLGRTDLYEASLLESFRRHLLPDGAVMPAIVFGPTRAEAPRSSLWYMCDQVVSKLTRSGVWIVRDGRPDWDLADRRSRPRWRGKRRFSFWARRSFSPPTASARRGTRCPRDRASWTPAARKDCAPSSRAKKSNECSREHWAFPRHIW